MFISEAIYSLASDNCTPALVRRANRLFVEAQSWNPTASTFGNASSVNQPKRLPPSPSIATSPLPSATLFDAAQKLGWKIPERKLAARRPPAQIEKWSRLWYWGLRAAVWDDECDRQRQESQLNEIKLMTERHTKVALAVQGKVIERLQKLDASELNPAAMARWIQLSINLERVARGAAPLTGSSRTGSSSEEPSKFGLHSEHENRLQPAPRSRLRPRRQ